MCSEVNATTSDNCFFNKNKFLQKKYSNVFIARDELPKIFERLASVYITVKNDVKTANVTIIYQ